jgi:type I restriction enzyme S subunit
MGDGWTQTTLGEAVEVTMGRQRSPKHATGVHLVPYLRAANVKDGRLELDDVLEMNFTPEEQAKFSLREGDVLVTEGCGSIAQLGASAAWNGDLPGTVCFQNTLLRLRARPGITLPGFVEVWARHAHHSGLWAAIASGTNIFHVGSRRAEVAPIRLPPIEEQERIVALSTDFSRLISAAEATAAAAEAALAGHLAAAPDGAPTPLGELCRLSSGPSWSSAEESRAPVEGATGVIGIKTTRPDGSLDPAERAYVTGLAASVRTITPASLILIRTNGNRSRIGNVYRSAPEIVGCAVSAFQILAEPVDPGDSSYLYWVLSSATNQSKISEAASGTTGLGNIAVKWLRTMPVPVPSPADRAGWVALAESLRETSSRSRRYVAEAEAMRRLVLHDLVGGGEGSAPAADRLVEAGVR